MKIKFYLKKKSEKETENSIYFILSAINIENQEICLKLLIYL